MTILTTELSFGEICKTESSSTKDQNKPIFKIEGNDEYRVMWVNSNAPPSEEIPLNAYCYEGYDLRDLKFFRLYKIIYIQDNIAKQTLLDWREVVVKEECKMGFKHLLDLVEAAKHFLR